jgi:hypothetical protein
MEASPPRAVAGRKQVQALALLARKTMAAIE